MSSNIDNNLFQCMKRTADSQPDAPALTFLDANLCATSYTYSTLFHKVGEIANRLQNRRLSKGLPLGILLESQQDQVVHYLAALQCGLVPAILTPPNRKLDNLHYLKNIRSVISCCSLSAIVTTMESIASEATVLKPNTLELAYASSIDDSTTDDTQSRLLHDAAFLQFSSGTTGIKRGVLVSHRMVLRQSEAYGAAVRLSGSDCIVSWLPLYHDMGFIACLNLPLLFGVHTVMIEPLDWVANPALYLLAVDRYRGTLGWHPNFAFSFMATRVDEKRICGIDLGSIRALINCSEPVTHSSQHAFQQRFTQYNLRNNVFCGCYAMAETTFALTHTSGYDEHYLDHIGPLDMHSQHSRPFVCVGCPLPEVQIRVVGAEGVPLADRCVGEIIVKSPFNMICYYNNPSATILALDDSWYKTGDLGYRVDDHLYVCGRKKDLLIIAGVNIYPQDVEELVGEISGVVSGRVAVFADFVTEMETEQAIVLAETEVPVAAQLQLEVEIRKRVTAAFQISVFDVHFVPNGWLIKNSAGKMARSENRRKWYHIRAGKGEPMNERSA